MQTDKSFSEKEFRVSLLMQAERRRPVEVAGADVDVTQFASIDQGVAERRVNYVFALTPTKAGKASKSGCALASDDAAVDGNATIGSTFLKDLAVDPDEESISSFVRALLPARPAPLPGLPAPAHTPVTKKMFATNGKNVRKRCKC